MANIRDVAKKAGVAASTVSRYINKSGYVSESSKIKIDKAIEELDYVPYDLNRSIIRTKVIGMVVPDISHPFFSTLIQNIEKILSEKSFSLMVFSSNASNNFIMNLNSNLIDGVIIADSSISSNELVKIEKPTIHLDRIVEGIPLICSDHKNGGYIAANELIKSGCKNIIQICGEQSTEIPSYLSNLEFQKTIQNRNLNIKTIKIEWKEFNFEYYRDVAEKILKDHPETDGVFGADMVAIAFLKAAQDLGKTIPDELKIVSYDGTFTTQSNSIQITTVVQNTKEIANRSVEILLKLINNNSVIENTIIDVTIKPGETT